MARLVKKGVMFYPSVNTRNGLIGDISGFKSYVIDLETGSTVINKGSGTFEELISDPNDHVGNTNGEAKTGDVSINVESASTLVAGDTFTDGNGNYYHITSISGLTLGLQTKIVVDIPSGTKLETVGNTGIYKVEYMIEEVGEYMLTVKHPNFGSVAMKYEVADNTLDDAVVSNTTRFDAIDRTLSSISGNSLMHGIS